MSRMKLCKRLIMYPVVMLTAAFIVGCSGYWSGPAHPPPPPPPGVGGIHWRCSYKRILNGRIYSSVRRSRHKAKASARSICQDRRGAIAKKCVYKSCIRV